MLVRDRHVLVEGLDVEWAQLLIDQSFIDEGVLCQLFDWYTVVLVHLQTLNHEEACLDAGWLLQADLVATVIDLRDQILHLKTMERRHTDKHLVQHDAQGPRVYLCAVATLLKKLWTGVKRSTADGKVGVRAIKDGGKTEVTDLDLELHLGQVDLVQERLLLRLVQALQIGLVREVQQDIRELHVAMDDVECPHILDALHHLFDDDTGLFLADVPTSFQKDSKIESISVLLHHVDVGSCFDSLMQSNCVR